MPINPTILGAIAGDTIGSVYEFNPTLDYNFNMFRSDMCYTDDSVMTLAVAQWLLTDPAHKHETLVAIMQEFGRIYPNPVGAYGGSFPSWLRSNNPQPYNSWGNGSAMRVSPVGFAFDTLDETLRVAQISAEVTHNHPEGIKGAQATAAAIFMARTGKSKDEIRDYVEQTFGYDLHRTCDDIRPDYGFKESCQETVPQSIIAFLDSKDYEDAIRLTVSLGGDADTMGAITGAIAVAFYKEMPARIITFTIGKMPKHLADIYRNFNMRYSVLASASGRVEGTFKCGITPENISHLESNQIFVFGSNLQGAHGAGAARYAMMHFGAVMGQGVGMTGQCYAIPTMHGGIDVIRPYVDQFITFATEHPEFHFLVTPIGCGIAGFRPSQMAALFARAINLPNVSLPQSFIQIILNNK